MKVKLLGTSSGECIPGIFCNCEICQYAREHKGREIRTRSQAIINDDMMIDWPADSFYHIVQNDIDASKIKYLLMTHSHSDHLYEEDMVLRGWPYAHKMTSDDLYIYGNKVVLSKFKRACDSTEPDISKHIHLCEIEMFKPIKIGRYQVVSLPANHMQTEDARLYLISENGKNLFYCTDTGILEDEFFDYFIKNNIYVDCMVCDCTFGKNEVLKGQGHLSIPAVKNMMKVMAEKNIIDDSTKVVLTHIAHNGGLTYNNMVEECKASKIITGYDGIDIEI